VKEETQLSPTMTVRGETDFAGFVGVRAGLSAGAVLPYAFVGYERVSGTVVNDAAPIEENERTHDGIGVGVGAEYRLARNFSIDGRYMYSDLGNEDYDFGGGPTSYGEQAHTFSLGVNFRF
jgi:outer membrane immunogenic protein